MRAFSPVRLGAALSSAHPWPAAAPELDVQAAILPCTADLLLCRSLLGPTAEPDAPRETYGRVRPDLQPILFEVDLVKVWKPGSLTV